MMAKMVPENPSPEYTYEMSRNRDVHLVVADCPKDLAEWFHYAEDLEGTTRNLQLFIKRVLVRTARVPRPAQEYRRWRGPQHQDQKCTAIANIVRQSKLVVGRDPTDRRIALLVLIANVSAILR